MGQRIIVATAFLLVLVACSDDAGQEPTTSSPETTTTTVPVGPGRLAILDSAGEVVVLDPEGSNRQAITESGGDPALHMQPIWSPDGSRLAWGQATGTGFGVGISEPGTGEITSLTTQNLPFYTYWSPNNRHLGLLHNGTSGVQFQIADFDQETTSVLDEDAPFYFSWSPEGDRVVTHAGADRVETIRPDGDRTTLDPTEDSYLSPQWTEAGVFHSVAGQLVIEGDDGKRNPIVAVSGLTMFVANPSGTSVALQSVGEGGPLTAATEDLPSVAPNTVVVVDVESGLIDTVTEGPALGFFWSPNGRSLLILTASADRVVPRVWDASQDPIDFAAYLPNAAMLQDTFPFFPQYAQSVRFWAPDSSAFAYAGDVDGETGIWIQSLDGDPPNRVSDGTWVAWSAPAP